MNKRWLVYLSMPRLQYVFNKKKNKSEWLYTIIPEAMVITKLYFFPCIYTALEIMPCSFWIHFTSIGNNP